MTLTRLHITDFQSLHDVEITVAPLTVIVGPSSSGKSALIRALRTLTANARGSSFVSSWAAKTIIEADWTDKVTDGTDSRGSVSLTRSAKTSNDAYVVTAPEGTPSSPPPSVYTKLSGTIPQEITEFLHIDPSAESQSLHFATQFDRPYLLGDSPAEVARTFAALTNVSVIFAAAREANRTRLSAAQTLKLRINDLAPLTAMIPGIRALHSQRSHLVHAEQGLAVASATRMQIENLTAHLQGLRWATETLAACAPTLARTIPTLTHLTALQSAYARLDHLSGSLSAASATVDAVAPLVGRVVPTLDHVLTAHATLTGYRVVLDALTAALHAQRSASEAHTLQESQIKNLNAAYTEALAASGTCPTCGQDTSTLTVQHTSTHTPMGDHS